MRSFTYVILGLFSIYSIQPPRAHAAPEITPDKVQSLGMDVYGEMEKEGYEFFDKQGKQVHARDFFLAPQNDLTMVSPPEADGSKMKIRAINHLDAKTGLKVTLVASDNQSAKVFSRRSFRLNPSDDGTTAKVKLMQTTQSMDRDIKQNAGVKSASLTKRMKTLFASLFGIPEAHAGFQGSEKQIFGALFVMLAGLYVFLTYGNLKSPTGRYIAAGLALAWIAVVGGYAIYLAGDDIGLFPRQ